MNRPRQITGWMVAGMLVVAALSGCGGSGQQQGSNNTGTPTPPEPPADSTVLLIAGQGPSPRNQKLSASREESVWWDNSDDRGHTIRFTDWPFREPQQDIYVEASKKSKKFHVYKNQDPGKYSYGIFPPVPGDPGLPGAQQTSSGPPDPPAVEVDP